MGNILASLMVLGLVAAIAWAVLQPSYLFRIRIENGKPRVAQGKVSFAFLTCVEDACERHGLTTGWVAAQRKQNRVSLMFSSQIPPACRQQLRNEWQFSQ